MLVARLATIALFFAALSQPMSAMFLQAPPSVPEPATMALFGAGALTAAGVRYLRNRRRDT